MPEDEREARRQAREARAAQVARAKAQKQRQLDEAMAQERLRQQAVLDRTEKLRAERLAREEGDCSPAPQKRRGSS